MVGQHKPVRIVALVTLAVVFAAVVFVLVPVAMKGHMRHAKHGGGGDMIGRHHRGHHGGKHGGHHGGKHGGHHGGKHGGHHGGKHGGHTRPPHHRGHSRPPHHGGHSRPPHHRGHSRPPHHGGHTRPPHHGGHSRPPHHRGHTKPPYDMEYFKNLWKKALPDFDKKKPMFGADEKKMYKERMEYYKKSLGDMWKKGMDKMPKKDDKLEFWKNGMKEKMPEMLEKLKKFLHSKNPKLSEEDIEKIMEKKKEYFKKGFGDKMPYRQDYEPHRRHNPFVTMCAKGWFLVYLWQTVWIIYALVNIFRKTPVGHLYYTAETVTPHFCVIFIFTMIAHSIQIVLHEIGQSRTGFNIGILVLATLMQVALLIGLCLLYRAQKRAESTLLMFGLKKDIWLSRILLINGIAFFFAWSMLGTIMALVKILMMHGMPHVAIITGHVALLVQVIVFFVLDLVFRSFTKFTISPYVIFTIILAVISAGHRNPFTIALLALVAIMFLVKCILMCVPNRRQKSKAEENQQQYIKYPEKGIAIVGEPPEYSEPVKVPL